MVVIVLWFVLMGLVVAGASRLRLRVFIVGCWVGCGMTMIGRLAVSLRIAWVLGWVVVGFV